ncbi:hypothetical protein AB0I68_08960 [Streptomyces sp. NPDC050448]|uniref:hypothetical protein n=1 Tax=Streptomyces sp. NPDC050448 TaxID=3155404 RepID=UPI00343F4BE7
MAAARETRAAGERSLLVGAGVGVVGIGMYIPFSLVFFHHVTGLSFALAGVVMTVTALALVRLERRLPAEAVHAEPPVVAATEGARTQPRTPAQAPARAQALAA